LSSEYSAQVSNVWIIIIITRIKIIISPIFFRFRALSSLPVYILIKGEGEAKQGHSVIQRLLQHIEDHTEPEFVNI
jgi:hypothetical protein